MFFTPIGAGLPVPRLDHALEFGAAVIGGGRARLNTGLGELMAARGAISFALPFLIGNGDIMLGLPRRRDAQIEVGTRSGQSSVTAHVPTSCLIGRPSRGQGPGTM
jgi:hypothetical protein